jgi:hypothetical protein
VNWALPLAALAIGLFFNELSGGNRLNIIAFPLLGTLAWNLLLYVILLAAWLGRLRRRDAPPARTWLERLVGSGSAAGGGGHPLLSRAFARFGTDWLRHGGPLTHARVRRNLHLSAAALAVGILIGMYWRALSVEYRAGWESTFVGPATLHGLLQAVLGPASAVTGIGLPSPDRLTALRWSEGNGEIAGPWIHLWAATATLFIIGPRLVLAALSALRAWRLRRRLPVPGREDFYVRRLLREARGQGATLRLIPYSFHPPAETLRRLRASLTDLFGAGTQAEAEPPVAYGDEEAWLARASFGSETDQILLLFNASATPEAEIHGDFADRVRRRLSEVSKGTALTALIDETAYRERLGDQAGARGRIESRRAAWDKVLRPHGLSPIAVDFSEPDDTALARRLEGALVRDPSLLSGVAA